MTMYHFTCVAPFLAWCLIGAVACWFSGNRKEVGKMEQTVNAPADISADYSFIMDDDSMSGDGIRAGDIVYFAACDHVDNSQIAAVQTPDSVELCRVWQHRRYIALVTSDLKRNSTVFQDADRDRVKIIGRAVAVLHMLNTKTEKGQDHEEK